MELSEGQMVNDVRLAVEGRTSVRLLGRSGGVILSPDEIYEEMKGLIK